MQVRRKTDNLAKQIQWNRSANPMESLNKTNGIVGQNQWICFLKAAVLFSETDSLTCRNRQTGDQNSKKQGELDFVVEYGNNPRS